LCALSGVFAAKVSVSTFHAADRESIYSIDLLEKNLAFAKPLANDLVALYAEENFVFSLLLLKRD
jgi:hypothetical protein